MTEGVSRLETIAPPKLSHRAAALRVVVGLTLAGALGGLLWAYLAPPVDAVVALTKKGQRIHGYFGDESDRVFLGGALAVGFLTVIAVVAATVVWQWRAHRGPLLAGALALGNVAAAGALATIIGLAIGQVKVSPIAGGMLGGVAAFALPPGLLLAAVRRKKPDEPRQ